MNQKDEKASYHMKIGKAEITATAYLENPQVICSYQGLFELDKLQNENKKLRECVCYYANPFNDNPDNDFNFDFAIQTLKEVGE